MALMFVTARCVQTSVVTHNIHLKPSLQTNAAAGLPTLGLGQITWFDSWEIKTHKINITTLDRLACPAQPTATATAAAAASAAQGPAAAAESQPAPCPHLLKQPEWLNPSSANDTRSAALMMSLSRDAYPKYLRMADDQAYRCAVVDRWRGLGVSNVTFVDTELFHAAVARAGRNVFVVIRGTDGQLQEENNGRWASESARLWVLHRVRLHGGFLVTARHVMPALALLLKEAFAQVAAEVGGSGAGRAGGGAAAMIAAAAEEEKAALAMMKEDAAAAATVQAASISTNATAESAAAAEAAATQQLPPPLPVVDKRKAGDDPLSSHPARLYFAGHSRGGAMSIVLSALLTSYYPVTLGRQIAGVYSFAAPKVGNLAFAREYSFRFRGKVYDWWNERDLVPSLPPQVWLGYWHLMDSTSRWRIWDGVCERASCGVADALAGRKCLALDCPTWMSADCSFSEKNYHPPNLYVDKIKACLPPQVLPDACLANL